MTGDGVLVLRVARAKIVRAAESAIVKARKCGNEISPAEVRRLLRVARSAPEFALGTWYVAGRCGCLIGNLLGGADAPRYVRSVRIGRMGNVRYVVGLQFDLDITDLLTRRQRDLYEAHDGETVLRVVDR